jgi:hypothetical protein
MQNAGRPPAGPFGMGQPGEMDLGSILSLPFSLATFVLWIVYWVKIHGYGKQLEEDDRHPHREDDRFRDEDDDEDDDRGDTPPPRRLSRPDDRIQ